MKKRITKWVAMILAVAGLFSAMALPASATWTNADGGTLREAKGGKGIASNKTIYAYHRDSNGNLLKYVEYLTDNNDEYVDGICLYGYDLIGFSSDQGLGESCVLTWAAENMDYGGYGQIAWQFYKLIGAKSITCNFTYQKQEATKFTVRHYIIDKNGYKTLYRTSTYSYLYGDNMNIPRANLPGYTLEPDYLSSISGPFTYDVLKAGKNVSKTLYYNYHKGSRQGEMYDRKKYTYSSDDYIAYCDNREISVTFEYRIKSYNVTFDANGGNGAPASVTKYYDEDLTLPTAVPTRSGFTFKGWGNTSTATTPVFQPGGFYASNSGRTLYAIWEADEPTAYTVSYNANGGSGAPATQTKYKDVALTLSGTIPTRSGYTFKGWATSDSSSVVSYQAGGTYHENEPVTLYAVWEKKAETYSVTYHANGGSGAPATQIKTKNVALTLSNVKPVRSGYTFKGWATSSTAATAGYLPGASYSGNTDLNLYAVWEKNVSTYVVSFHANGGSGAPASQVKTEGTDLILSTAKPVKANSLFLGWSKSAGATTADYSAGSRFTEDKDTVLYAVWEEAKYDFSVSNLTVDETEVYRYGTANIQVRADSWDKVNSYTGVPVELLYDGTVIGTQNINLGAYGVAYVPFTLNVGNAVGNHTIEARVNWNLRSNETNTANNSVSAGISVMDFDYELSAEPIVTPDSYCEGTTVVSSFTVRNDSNQDILPSHHNSASFSAYYYNGSTKAVIWTDKKTDVVIPSGGSNLVYFKWTVPGGLTGKTVYCECTVNSDNSPNEENRDNNTVVFQTVIQSVLKSQTPDTRYERTAPAGYSSAIQPVGDTATGRSWTEWVYENGRFVLKTYGIRVDASTPVLKPDVSCPTAEMSNGRWTIKSGYGITLEWNPSIIAESGCSMPASDSFTGIQTVYAAYPEYGYQESAGACDNLSYSEGSFRFCPNANADGNARVHFIPVYAEDGDYSVSVAATQIWTPAGMLKVYRNSDRVTIEGTIYDDYYVGN